MSRQIIKTRPQRPYIIARIVIAAIVIIIVLIAIAYAVAERRARTHDVTLTTRASRSAGLDVRAAEPAKPRSHHS